MITGRGWSLGGGTPKWGWGYRYNVIRGPALVNRPSPTSAGARRRPGRANGRRCGDWPVGVAGGGMWPCGVCRHAVTE